MDQEYRGDTPQRPGGRPFFREFIESLAIAIILAVIIRLFILEPFYIPSASMVPALRENDRIIVSKLNYYFKEPQRGDVIVFKYPNDPKRNFVKRLVAAGGEEVEFRDSDLYIDGHQVPEDYLPANLRFADYGPVMVPPDHYFMVGDNRNNSEDSRVWGYLPQELIVGKAVVIYWPPGRISPTR